jgi:gliding motility-associated-like protein
MNNFFTKKTAFTLAFFASALAFSQGTTCNNAISVSSNGCSGTVDNTSVAGNIVPLSCFSGGNNNSMWFTFVASQPTVVININGGTLANTMVGLLEDETTPCGGTFFELACNNPTTGNASLTYANLTVGGTYYIIVDGVNNDVGTFQLCLNSPSQPSNDVPCNAVILPTTSFCSGAGAFTNVGATAEGFGICNDGLGADNSVWFSFVATNSGIDITVTGTSLTAPVIQLMTDNGLGCTSNTWGISGCNGPGGVTASLNINFLVPGTTYYLLVDGLNGATGSFGICANAYTPTGTIPNDDCVNAQLICPNSSITGTTRGATPQPLTDPKVAEWNCNGVVNDDVWYKFVASNPVADVVFNIRATCDNESNTQNLAQFEVFRLTGGTICETSATFQSLGCVQANQGALRTVTVPAASLVAGQTYYVLVDDWPDDACDFEFTATGGIRGSNAGANETACIGDAPFNLSGATPTGGAWAGVGITNSANGTFSPANAGLGTHSVFYTESGCTSSKNVIVSGPVITAMADFTVCEGSSINLAADLSIICQETFSNNTSTSIPNNNATGITTNINVTGVVPTTLSSGVIAEICFVINHGRHDELAPITITAPNGTTYNYPTPLPNNSGTVTYCFPVLITDGMTGNTNGTWSIRVVDNVNRTGGTIFTGSLTSWTIIFNTQCSPAVSWTPTTNMTGATTLTPTVNPINSTTIYSVSVTDDKGCTSTDQVTVNTINCATCSANAVMSLSGTSPICVGSCSQISIEVSGGTGPFQVIYTDGTTNFTLGSGSEPAGTYNIPVCPTTTTTYSIVSIYDIGDDCTGINSGSAQVVVNPLPTVGGDTQVCVGLTANVTPNIGGTWVSSNTGRATVTNGGVVTGVSAGSVTLTFTDGTTNCQNSIDVEVIARTVPTFTQLGPYCQGATPDVLPTTSDNGITGTWNAAISTASSGTITYTFTPTAGLCASQSIMNIEVIGLPIATNLTPSVCADVLGGTTASGVDLTANNSSVNGNGTASFTWYQADGTTLVATPNNTTVSNGQVFIVQVTLNGCSSSATVTYTVTDNITLEEEITLCGNASGQLTGVNLATYNTTVYGGTATFQWYTDATKSATISTPSSLTINNGDQFFVVVTAGNCLNETLFTFNIATPPNAGTGNTLTVCSTDASVDLFSLLGGSPETTGAWSGPSTLAGAHLGTLEPSTASSGTYTYTVTATTPCNNATANIVVTINETPDADFNPLNSSYCLGELPLQLTAIQTGGVFSGTGVTDNGDGTGSFTVGAIGNYTITYSININGCPNTSSQDIEIVNSVVPTFDNLSYCFGTTTTLPSTSNNGYEGTWSPTLNTDVLGDFNYTFTPNDQSCAVPVDVTITILPLPTATITGGASICAGEELPDLIISFTGEGPWTYNLNGTDATTSDNPLIFTSPANGGTFTVTTVTDVNCTNSGNSSSTQVVVTTPVASFESNPSEGVAPLEVFFTNTSNGTSFSWEFGDGNTSIAENPTNTYTALGEYIVTLTITVNGCTATATDVITVIGGSTVELPNVFSPDGTGGNELFKAISENMSFERFQIFNRWGQLMYEGPAWDGTHNGQKVPEGTYYYIYYGEGADGKIYEGADYTGHLTLVRSK